MYLPAVIGSFNTFASAVQTTFSTDGNPLTFFQIFRHRQSPDNSVSALTAIPDFKSG